MAELLHLVYSLQTKAQPVDPANCKFFKLRLLHMSLDINISRLYRTVRLFRSPVLCSFRLLNSVQREYRITLITFLILDRHLISHVISDNVYKIHY